MTSSLEGQPENEDFEAAPTLLEDTQLMTRWRKPRQPRTKNSAQKDSMTG
jgi:hypothetical protein